MRHSYLLESEKFLVLMDEVERDLHGANGGELLVKVRGVGENEEW